MMHKTFVLALASLSLLAAPVMAAEIEVKMLNKGSDGEAMVFEPALIKAAPGDVIKFIPTDKGHDVASVKGAIPEGAEEIKGKFNQELSVTVDKEGAYLVKCTPHLAMGMVAVITVGSQPPANLDAVKSAKLPKKAKERLDAALASAGL
ncbi:pseudoazurin [Xanthobacteraceae bacterium A53D]